MFWWEIWEMTVLPARAYQVGSSKFTLSKLHASLRIRILKYALRHIIISSLIIIIAFVFRQELQ
jgi:hypothetical protein